MLVGLTMVALLTDSQAMKHQHDQVLQHTEQLQGAALSELSTTLSAERLEHQEAIACMHTEIQRVQNEADEQLKAATTAHSEEMAVLKKEHEEATRQFASEKARVHSRCADKLEKAEIAHEEKLWQANTVRAGMSHACCWSCVELRCVWN